MGEAVRREGRSGGRRGALPPPCVYWLRPGRAGPTQLAIGCMVAHLHTGRGDRARLGPVWGARVATAAT